MNSAWGMVTEFLTLKEDQKLLEMTIFKQLFCETSLSTDINDLSWRIQTVKTSIQTQIIL